MSSFAEQIIDHAVRQPSAPALGWHGRWVSYAELADLTRQAGTRTEGWGSGPVAVVSKKSPETLALVLACVLADRPVLLPSPDLGRRALDLLVDQVGCQRVATVTGAGIESRAVHGPDPHPVGATARFLLTTSGSTGVPKIVPLPAEATERFVRWAATRFAFGPGVTVLNHAPLNFDLCLLDIWAMLGPGGCVALVDPTTRARLGGAHLPHIVSRCIGTDQVEVLARAVACPEEITAHQLPSYRLLRYVRYLNLIMPAEGVVHPEQGWAPIRALDSFLEMVVTQPVGRRIERTVDLATSPGYVYLSAEDPAQVDADYARLRELERNGLYTAQP